MHTDMTRSGLPETIREEAEVVQLITHLIQLEDLNFHPDTPFEDYVCYEDGKPTYTPEECCLRNRLVDECFELVGDRVYDIGLEIFLPTILPPLTKAL
jgi:hypothetical protein